MVFDYIFMKNNSNDFTLITDVYRIVEKERKQRFNEQRFSEASLDTHRLISEPQSPFTPQLQIKYLHSIQIWKEIQRKLYKTASRESSNTVNIKTAFTIHEEKLAQELQTNAGCKVRHANEVSFSPMV